MMTYKFRIYPNDQQIAILEEIIETCRLLYNQSLEERLKDEGLKYYEQKRKLTQIRKKPCGEGTSTCQEQTGKYFDEA